MREIFRKLAGAVHRLTPKLNHAVIWAWPDGEDNSIALEQALQGSTVRKVILLAGDTDAPPTWDLGAKTLRVSKDSPGGWLRFCFARYVFFTHPCYTRRFPSNVVSVNVWHGMPIKRIGGMIEGDPAIRSSHTLATSPFWGDIMRRTISPSGAMLAVGLPRNDRLFSEKREVMGKLGLPAGTKLLAWLPTYRKSVRGLPRTDGIDTGTAFGMADLEPETLNAFLAQRNSILLVKPHPMAAFQGLRQWSHLLVVDDAWLGRKRVSLYEALGATELLISDISSVVIDYLLLDRPIIHAFPDLAEYKDSRGFTVEPVEDHLAGPVVSDQAGLLAALGELLDGADPDATRRDRMRQLSHAHTDGKAVGRLLRELGISG
ncbi:CDP-glycerol glycerophosphotransferase family protein [Akkermansiaceae bacterium]|nr:CDP-glycerol glycerophosphotransferase family protein [Akkermansiaceae bacterium]